MSVLEFKSGYKHQVHSDITAIVGEFGLVEDIDTPYLKLTVQGLLTIKRGYAWDGVSGPIPDSRWAMKGSLFHDALYELMRKGLINLEWAGKADLIFKNTMIKDRAWKIIAHIYYVGVKRFGHGATKPSRRKPIKRAP